MKTSKQQYLTDLYTVLRLKNSDNPVELDAVPLVFRQDLNHFIMGETLQAINGKIVVGKKRYNSWVNKVMTIGLDYVIELENS